MRLQKLKKLSRNIALFTLTTLVTISLAKPSKTPKGTLDIFKGPVFHIPKSEDINLKSDERPDHISSYEWYTQQVRKYVFKKRKKVLALLDITTQEVWEEKKSIFTSAYYAEFREKERADQRQRRPLPEHIKKAIYNVIKDPYIQKIFEIKAISEKKNQIIAERYNKKQSITFECEKHKDPLGLKEDTELSPEERKYARPKSAASIKGNSIKIVPEFLYDKNQLITIKRAEACLCHELAHILKEHILEQYCLSEIFSQQQRENNTHTTAYKFLEGRHEFSRAFETEADINASFKNTKRTIALIHFLEDERQYVNPKDPTHPPIEKRINYLKRTLRPKKSFRKPTQPEPTLHFLKLLHTWEERTRANKIPSFWKDKQVACKSW